MILIYVLIGVLALFLPFYIWTEYNWEQKKYFYNKLFSSFIFVLIGLVSFLKFGLDSNYGIFILIALVLGMIGDGFLVYDKDPKYFQLGLVTFLVGQIVYGTTFLVQFGFMWYDLLIFISILAIAFSIYPKTNIKLGEMKPPVIAYYVIITFMFSMAISSLYKGEISSATLLISIGATLFLASDVVLTFNIFDDTAPKWTKTVVLVLYYSAQVLLGLSIIAMA